MNEKIQKSVIQEGKAKFYASTAEKDVSKELPVFYNPLMKLNRDISILLLNSIDKKELQIADPLAGSGVRSIRFLLELEKGRIKTISVNDKGEKSYEAIKTGLELNKIKDNIIISNKDANLFMLESSGFDYIDIDPFGTPNHFLDSAIVRISRGGVLAVTATDTAPLSGTFPKTCKRKYWAAPIRNEHMHEIGLRILIRKIQLIAAQYEKALTPVFSYSKDHYFRTYLTCEKSKTKADEVIKSHKFFHYCPKCLNYFTSSLNSSVCCEKETIVAGPLYSSNITETKLAEKMLEKCEDKKTKDFIDIIKDESKIDNVGFLDLHQFSKKYKVDIPKLEIALNKFRKAGFKAEKTQFNSYSIKTDAKIQEIMSIIKTKV